MLLSRFGRIKWQWALGLTLFAISFGIGYRVVTHQRAFAQISTKPYLVEMHVYSYTKNPQGALWLTSTHARRDDGSTVAVYSEVGERPYVHRRVLYADGMVRQLEDVVRMKASSRRTEDELLRWRQMQLNPPEGCAFGPRQSVLRQEQFLGVTASVIQEIDRDKVLTYWRAPSLSCVELQYQVERKNPDGSLTLLTKGLNRQFLNTQPPDQLFDAGADYQEGPPSAIVRAQWARWGKSPQEFPANAPDTVAADKAYYAHRP
jgi:hypothetical protein